MERLSDSELLAALERMAAQHRELVARMVEHLAEVERRRLHLALGHSSLFGYARERLGLSEHEAYLRITAARAAARNEEILPALESGELSLTTVKTLAPHLDSQPALVGEARGKSRRQVERLVAERAPSSSVRTELRTRAIPGGRVEITCVVSEETAELLEEALDLTMHENPERDAEAALAKALRLLVAEKKKPRGRVPAKVEREVTAERRCSFVGIGGRVCGEKRFVELDHIVPRAQGGSDEPGNLRWLCRAHNQFEAERQLGPDRVRRAKVLASLSREVASALVGLGFSKAEAADGARRGIASAGALGGAGALELEAVLRAALISLKPSHPLGAKAA